MSLKHDLNQDPLLTQAPVIGDFKVLPPCVIVEKLDEGAMGAVYRGYHYNLEIDVAIKCLKSELVARNREFLDRFQREAKLAAHITQENLVRVYDTLQQHGVFYTIMEFVDGENVQGRVQRKGPLTPQEALSILLPATRALAALHDRKIVHRDIKPPNIMVSQDGQVKLADLGIAKSEEGFDNIRTHAQAVMGTPQYMAPEQFDSAANVNDRADIYAIGAVLSFMLYGDHVVNGKSLEEILKKVVVQGFPDMRGLLPQLPDDLYALIKRCTAARPGDRPDARSLVREMNQLLVAYGGEMSLADREAGHSLGTAVLPSRLDRNRIELIRNEMTADRTPPTQVNRGRGEVPATIQQLPGGGYTVTGGSSGQQVIVVPPQQGGGAGKWILILLLLGIVGAGAVIGLVPEIRTKVLASMGVQQQTGESGGSTSGGTVAPAPLPRLRIIDAEVWEGPDGRTTPATFRVETAGTFKEPITVDWKVVHGAFGGKAPATEADLAEPTSGKLTIEPGGSGSIVLNVKGNNRFEPDKALAVEISNPAGATIDRAQAVLTILNDDPKPTIPTLTLTGPPAGVVEGNDGTTDAVFTVRLSEKIDRDVTLKFSTLDATPLHGTAAANDDYIPIAGQALRIAAGETETQAIVKIKGDTLVEPDEKLTVFIHDASGADIAGNGQATVTIRNDDQPPLPTLTILDAAPVQEGNPPNAAELVFVVRLSEPTTELVTFDAMTIPAGVANAATAGEDFDAVPRQTYTIRAGLQQIEIRVRVRPDTAEEPDEIVAVQIANAGGAKIDRDRATGTILNDDRPNVVENPPQQNFQQLALAIEQSARVGQWDDMLDKLAQLAAATQPGQTSEFVRTANTALAQFRLRNAIRAARTAQFPKLREQLDKIIAAGEPVEAVVTKIEMLIEYDREDQIEIVTRNNPQATAGFREAINLAGKLVNGNHRNRVEVYGYVGDVFFTVPALQDVRLALQWYEAGSQAGAAYCTARKGNLLWQSARANNDQQMFQQAIAAMKQASEQEPVHRYALHLYGYFLLLQYDQLRNQNPDLARQYFQEGSALLRRASDMGFQASLKELIRRGLN